MTDKQIIIKLKPMEDLNEKIIKEKGNTECIFYADDICRNGDKTRDCVNCARVEYHSLYSLNWDNQERLQKIIKHKEQECENVRSELIEANKQVIYLAKQLDQLKGENERLQEEREKAKNYNLEYGQLLIKATNKNNKLSKTLAEIKEIAEKASKSEDYLLGQEFTDIVDKILQEISEVSNDMENN